MKEYFKMSDVFGHALHDGSTLYTLKSKGFRHGDEVFVNDVCAVFSGHNDAANYAAHAINSHDELVENMQHYKQEAEQWEARATKGASRAQDLEAEVERLCEIIMLAIEVNGSMASAVPATDWGSGFKECATATSKALMETASKHSSQWVAYQIAKRGK